MATPKRPPPKKKPKDRYTPMSKLHVLLAKAFPERRTSRYDVFDIEWLAIKLKVTDEGVYTWLRANALTMKRARQIVALRECRIELEDLLPFVV